MKLLILSIAFFSLTLILSVLTKAEPTRVGAQDQLVQVPNQVPTPTPYPTLPPTSVPALTATSVFIFDPDQHGVLYARNADLLVFPASTTKMLTALVASHYYSHQEVVTVPAFKIEGQKMGLMYGERISIENLLYGLLVFSGNDAAEVLARHYPQGRAAFIEAMNIEARKLGMTSSVFKNPTGLDEAGHVSTAREMSLLGQAVMADPYLRPIVGTSKATVESVDGKFAHRLVSTNDLLTTVPGVVGIKTGWTEEAHENLVTYVSRDNHTYVISLFGSDDRFGETKQVIDWVYSHSGQ